VFAQLGLWQETPEKELKTAATAYAAGDLEKSSAAADEARLTWIGAAGVGRTRALMILGAVIGVVLLIALAILTLIRVRRGGRRTTEVATAGQTVATDPDPTEIVPRIDTTTPEPPA
jgi:HAMP domain-containing protein